MQQLILKMLNKKSRNYVKYILWISIVEFFLILAVSLYYSYQGNDGESLIHILEKMQVKMTLSRHFRLGVKMMNIEK